MNTDNKEHNSSVAIIRFGTIGDVTGSLPIIYSACMCYQDVRFVVVTHQPMDGLFVNKPQNLGILCIKSEEYKGINGARKLVKQLRDQYHVTAVADLQGSNMTRLMVLLCRLQGIKASSIGNTRHRRNSLTRRGSKVMLPLVPTNALYREALFNVGLPIEETFDSLYGNGNKAAPELFANITTMAKGHNDKWIGIAPFAMYTQKEYPLDKMEEVIKDLVAHQNIHIFVFGGDGREKACADAWADRHHNVTSLAGNNYGLGAELALISNLDVMLTMDSANMHLASIAGTPTISIWGATHEYCGFKGWRHSSDDMVQVPLSCRPCSLTGDKDCYRHDLLCLTAIRPETIYNKIMDRINNEH